MSQREFERTFRKEKKKVRENYSNFSFPRQSKISYRLAIPLGIEVEKKTWIYFLRRQIKDSCGLGNWSSPYSKISAVTKIKFQVRRRLGGKKLASSIEASAALKKENERRGRGEIEKEKEKRQRVRRAISRSVWRNRFSARLGSASWELGEP